ncbi:hypothetical protein [Amycolatopsis sp. NPDC049159]|uniref:hypothetical protein n=1 Tax=Amycolatopsis sp. NPDC049159 TaxID=3157210 RepID=UPI0033FDB0A5
MLLATPTWSKALRTSSRLLRVIERGSRPDGRRAILKGLRMLTRYELTSHGLTLRQL